MNKFTAILVDDKLPELEYLRKCLSDWTPQIEVVGMFQSAEAALPDIILQKAQLLFLDIQMGGISGLDLFQRLAALEMKRSPECIIVSCLPLEDGYRKARRLGVIDYIEKPLEETDLVNAVTHTCNRLLQQSERKQLEELLTIMGGDRLFFPTAGGFFSCHPFELLHVVPLDGKKTRFYLNDGTSREVLLSMMEAAKKLTGTRLLRADRENIVNLNAVTDLDHTNLTLSSGTVRKTITLLKTGAGRIRRLGLKGGGLSWV